MFLRPGWPTHPCLQVLFCVFGCVVEAKGTLSKDVFEQRTSTGSEAFSLFICLDANKLVLLSFFSLLKTIYPRVSSKPLPNDAKSPLPVDVRRSKTLLLKLPKIVWFGGCTQISFKSHNLGFTCRSQKRFSLFYSSSKALSDDISLTWKLKTAFNPFW